MKSEKMHTLRDWDQEEVCLLVTGYFRTKGQDKESIRMRQMQISKILRKREEILTKKPVPDRFRNFNGIALQMGRIRCLDPETNYYGMKGTKLQREVIEDYFSNPSFVTRVADELEEKYGAAPERSESGQSIPGYALTEGALNDLDATDEQLFAVLKGVFGNKAHNSTYKFVFFKALMDEIVLREAAGEDETIPFEILFQKFAESYWKMVFQYGMKQSFAVKDGRETFVEQIIHDKTRKYGIAREAGFHDLSLELQTEIVDSVLKKCTKYVVGALYGDTKGYLYSFSVKEHRLTVNHRMIPIISRNKAAIEKLNIRALAEFLEKVNGDATIKKYFDFSEYNQEEAVGKYERLLLELFGETGHNDKCGSTGRDLQKGKASLDDDVDNIPQDVLENPIKLLAWMEQMNTGM